MSFETVSVIGLGYIGLPTAAMFASHGVSVVGVDVNQTAVDTINRGEIHIVEPDLDAMVAHAVSKGFLKAATIPEAADAFLVAVPTPFNEVKDGIPQPDLSFIKAAALAIAPVLKSGDLVILESTSPVGATEKMAEWISQSRPDLTFPFNSENPDVNIAHCPERVLPGHVVRELVENDRVIGGITPACSKKAKDLYQIFVKGECVITNARTAEMAKLTENASRDVSIAFANELSMICSELDINVWELIALANRHPRVNILQPGPGVGGHCIAVDPWFIVSKSPSTSRLIATARRVNDQKPSWVVSKVKEKIGELLVTNPDKKADELVIACYGLAFKPDIDDLRESPALDIARQIIDFHPGKTICIEPNVGETIGDSIVLKSASDSADADIHVLLVDHKEFKNMPPPAGYVIDTKGIWEQRL